jgi:hypothetical protein
LQKHDAAGKESGGGAEPCPSWVKEGPTFTSDQYKIQIGGKDVDVPGSEIIAFNEPDPANPYWRGAGVAEALADELDTDEFAAKFTKSFFFNRARPDLVIFRKDLDREEAKRLEQDFVDKNRGFWRAFNPYLMPGELQIRFDRSPPFAARIAGPALSMI